MGKATITSHLGQALYSVTYKWDTVTLQNKQTQIDTRVTELDTEITAAQNEANAAYGLYQSYESGVNNAIAAYNASPTPENRELLKVAAALANTQWQAYLDARAYKRTLELEQHDLTIQSNRIANRITEQQSISTTLWCADFTVNLAGTVGVINLNQEWDWRDVPSSLIINPGSPEHGGAAYDVTLHGMDQDIIGNTPYGTFYNLAVLPGLQRGKPYYVKAVILEIDPDTNTAKIRMLPDKSAKLSFTKWGGTADPNATSSAVVQTEKNLGDLDVRPRETKSEAEEGADPYVWSGVQFEYMVCNWEAFEVGDEVVIRFDRPPNVADPDNPFKGDPKVIGFVSNPRPCGSEGFLNTRFGTPTNGGSSGSDLSDLGDGLDWVQEDNNFASATGYFSTSGDPVYYQMIDNIASDDSVMWISGPSGRHFHNFNQKTFHDSGYTQPAMIWGKRYGRGRRYGNSNTGSSGYAPTFRLGSETRFVGIGLQNAGTASEHVVAACISRWPGLGLDSESAGDASYDGYIDFYRAKWPTVTGQYADPAEPNGWRYLGSAYFPPSDYFACDSPVFFNESGTEAVHVRIRRPATVSGTRKIRSVRGRGSFTGAGEYNPKYIDYKILKVTIPNNNSEDISWEYVPSGLETCTHKRWNDAATSQTNSDRRIETTGSYSIYADYVGDTMVFGKINITDWSREVSVHTGAGTYVGTRTLKSRRLYELEFTALEKLISDGQGGVTVIPYKVPMVDADWNIVCRYDETNTTTDTEIIHAGQNINGAYEEYESLYPDDATEEDDDADERYGPWCRTVIRELGYVDIRSATMVLKERKERHVIEPVSIRYNLYTAPTVCTPSGTYRKARSRSRRTSEFAQVFMVAGKELARFDERSEGPEVEPPFGGTKQHENCLAPDGGLGATFHWYNLTCCAGYDTVFCSYGDGDLYEREGPAGVYGEIGTHTHWIGLTLWHTWRFANYCKEPNGTTIQPILPEGKQFWTSTIPFHAMFGDFELQDVQDVTTATGGINVDDLRAQAYFENGQHMYWMVGSQSWQRDDLWGVNMPYICREYEDDLTGFVPWTPLYYSVQGAVATDIIGRNMFISANVSGEDDSVNTGTIFEVNFLPKVGDPVKGNEVVGDPNSFTWDNLALLIGTPAPYFPIWPDDPNDSAP